MSVTKKDPTIAALEAEHAALRPLDAEKRQRVLESVYALLGMESSKGRDKAHSSEPSFRLSEPGLPKAVPAVGPVTPRDIRSFFSAKSPSSDVEAAAVAAYYYKYVAPESDRHDTVDSQLLLDAFRLARRPLPRRSIYTLQNARNAGYLDSVGDGQYRLNAVGYNLVEHSLGRAQAQEKPKVRRPR